MSRVDAEHAWCAERLLDHVYGELAGRARRRVEAHLAACGACRAEVAAIEATRRAMSALPVEAAPARGEAVLLAAAREATRARARPRAARWLWATPAIAGIAVVTVVAVTRLGADPWRTDGRAAPEVASVPPARRAETQEERSAPAAERAKTEERPATAAPRPAKAASDRAAPTTHPRAKSTSAARGAAAPAEARPQAADARQLAPAGERVSGPAGAPAEAESAPAPFAAPPPASPARARTALASPDAGALTIPFAKDQDTPGEEARSAMARWVSAGPTGARHRVTAYLEPGRDDAAERARHRAEATASALRAAGASRVAVVIEPPRPCAGHTEACAAAARRVVVTREVAR